MKEDQRPNPDVLLSVIKREEKVKQQGYFRIFMGMSAGVGKTYAMLKAAHQKSSEGFDVVIGVVESHGRKETHELIQGLEVIPKKQLNYKGTVLEEMDIDAILKRKPSIVIVDELAHTNISGSRHEKRYQDVLEIIENGIDVYSAFNVQHLESRKDAVEAITGVLIRETIPDSVLDFADQVELIDIAPNELLKRLKEGKVYLGDKAERAAQNFFKEDKLTALREIALRMTAEKVDQDLQKFINIRTAEGNLWQTNERLLVAFSHSPYSEKLIRATRRLAYNLDAPWVALHVNTGISLNDTDQMQLVKNLNLAKELNGEVITTTDIDVPSAVKRVCRQKNVTQVVVGRPTRRWFRDVIEGGSLLDRLVRETLDVDVHIIRHDGGSLVKPKLVDEVSYYRTRTGLTKYWYSLWSVIGIAVVSMFLESWIGYRSVGFIFLLGVIVNGFFGSLGVVLLAASMSALIWNYFFIPPKFTFVISNSEDILMCLAFFVVALITGFLTNRIRFHEKVIRDREQRTNLLYEILQDIAAATEKSEFLNKVVERTGSIIGGNCGVILKDNMGKLDFNDAKIYSIRLNEKDQAVAQWAFEKNKATGWSTDTLSEARALYLPLKGIKETVGVFVFQPVRKLRKLDLDKENLLISIVGQLGTSIERHFLNKRLAEAQRLKDSEKLHQTLLSSISHELRTPLTAIMGTAAALEADVNIENKENIKRLAKDIQLAGGRLNRVIENLLDMSRLSSGVLSLKLEWQDMNDLINVVVQKLEVPLQKHKVIFHLLDKLVLLKIDFRLMEHAISNILLNAAMYSLENSEISIHTEKDENYFKIIINDQGPGIPDESIEHIFERFYRVPGSPPGGTGLGLSIVKSIVELHKGFVKVENLKLKGCSFMIGLPLSNQPNSPKE